MAEKNSVIIDTSFLVGLANQRDRFHKKAKDCAEKYYERDWITTWPVLVELNHLVPTRSFLQLLQLQTEGLFSVFTLDEGDMPRLIKLVEKYTDQKIDCADLSLIILAEYLDHGDILTCDRKDFSFLRWKRNRPFQNLFFL